MVVEAMPDPVGLKMGVIVGINVDSQELIYQRFQCKNEAIFNISEITGEDISFYGGAYANNTELPFSSSLKPTLQRCFISHSIKIIFDIFTCNFVWCPITHKINIIIFSVLF